MTKKIGYVRLSRDDGKGMSVENQTAALLAYDPKMKIFIDKGVSGETNLTDPKSQWSQKVRPLFQEDPANTQIVVFSYDRIGRKKGKVLSEVEDITDAGGSLHVIREGRTFTDSEEAAQAIELTFRSLTDESYRTEIKRKTQAALDVFKVGKVPLGRKPSLTEAKMLEIRKLRERGLGYKSIGRVMGKLKEDGTVVAVSARVIKRVLAGEYESREAFEARDYQARQELLARTILGE